MVKVSLVTAPNLFKFIRQKLHKFLHVSYFFFFILLLFRNFFFLDFLSDKISRKCSSYESSSDEIAHGIQDYK